MIEILAKPSRASGRQKIEVGRRDDPHVHRFALRRAEATDGALFEHGEELGLEALGEGPDLVQKERAPVSRLEEPAFRLAGIREGPPLEPEHLGFEESLGDRRAVHVDEGPPGPGACPVERPGHEPLAATGLSLDQNGWQTPDLGGARDQAGDLLPDGSDPGAFADEIGQKTHGIRHPAP